MQTRSSLQRRSNSEHSDRVVATIKPRSWGDETHEQPQTVQPKNTGFDFKNADWFSHDPGPRSPVRVFNTIQAKLTVGAPNDVYEQEADRVAEQVMSTPDSAIHQPIQRDMAPDDDELQTKPLAATITPLVQREMAPEEEEPEPIQGKLIQREMAPEEEEDPEPVQGKLIQREAALEDEEDPEPVQGKPALQRKESPTGFQAQSGLEHQLDSSKGGGTPLPDDVRAFMEPRFGADFSQVRVHTGSDAVQMNRELNAQAFAHKQDVYFGAGKSPGNDALTAHELTHVVQQNSGQIQPLLQRQEKSHATSALQRVQAAIAANNLPSLLTIQQDLLQQMLLDPLHPPDDVRAGLATARHWMMDRIAATRDTYASQITAASTGRSTGTDGTGTVETIETSMDTDCTPYLEALMKGDPQYRYEHFDTTISEKVFAAVRLHSARRGVGQIGHRAKAEAESRVHGRLPEGAWCGAFAYTQAEQGGGFDRHWVGSMQGEGGIRAALEKGGNIDQTWIWVVDDWKNLKAYHADRGSVRWYEEIQRSPPSKGIQAGDLVLMDNAFGTNPDHITTAISFDGRFLTTVGGNQGSDAPSDEKGVSKSSHALDLQNNPEPNDVRKTNAKGERIREVDPNLGPKHTRIHGIGRWSVVDYERHLYKTSSSKPKPPSAAELSALG